MLDILLIIALLLGFPMLLLWSIERLARKIGGRKTALLFIGIIPALAGLVAAYLNRENLRWWEFILYPMSGPLVACGLVLFSYAAVSPFGIPDLFALACRLVSRGYKLVRRKL